MFNKMVIIIIGILMMISGCKKQFDLTKLRGDIEKVIATEPDATIAIAFEDLKTGEKIFINEKNR